jgi:hypothetical protein
MAPVLFEDRGRFWHRFSPFTPKTAGAAFCDSAFEKKCFGPEPAGSVTSRILARQ